MLQVLIAMLLAQVLSSPLPSATACPPTSVVRIPTTKGDTEWSGHLRENGVSLVLVEVLLTITPNGTIKSAVVTKPGNSEVDSMALVDSKVGTYKPATVNCQPVEGTYLFKEMFYNMKLFGPGI
jgi:hypothetical protein